MVDVIASKRAERKWEPRGDLVIVIVMQSKQGCRGCHGTGTVTDGR